MSLSLPGSDLTEAGPVYPMRSSEITPFLGELGVENHFELTDGGEKFAVTVAGMLLNAVFETISRNELEKLLEDAIVIHCRAPCVSIEGISVRAPQKLVFGGFSQMSKFQMAR